MLQIKITSKGHEQIQKDLDNIKIKSKQDAIKIGEFIVETMKSNIRTSIKRVGSSGILENSIRSHISTLGKKIIVEVARVAELPIYWAVQNFGSSHLLGKKIPGYFGSNEKPQAGMSGQAFTYKRKSFVMVPKRPIPAMNFVERTWASIRAIIPTLLSRR